MEKPGVGNYSKQFIKDVIDVWKISITKNIISKIIKFTNARIKYKNIDKKISCLLLEKKIGLVYLKAVLAMRKAPIKFI